MKFCLVHCKAGKGRTGLMICSLLLFLKVDLTYDIINAGIYSVEQEGSLSGLEKEEIAEAFEFKLRRLKVS